MKNGGERGGGVGAAMWRSRWSWTGGGIRGGVIGILKKTTWISMSEDVQVIIALVDSSAWACFVGFG